MGAIPGAKRYTPACLCPACGSATSPTATVFRFTRGLIDRPRPDDPEMVEGVPSHLNELLARGEIDVAPCSSIEYARHAERYRILPDLVIGSRGAVRSILLIGDRPPEELDGRTIALPTASATSVVLLRILLRVRWRVTPHFLFFDQRSEDPWAGGADAALFIGDVALRADPGTPTRFGWTWGRSGGDETGLPFAFAVWQAWERERPATPRVARAAA